MAPPPHHKYNVEPKREWAMPPPPPRPRGSIPGATSSSSNIDYRSDARRSMPPPPPNVRGNGNPHLRLSQSHQRPLHQKQSSNHHTQIGNSGNKKRRFPDDRGPFSKTSRSKSNEHNTGNKRPHWGMPMPTQTPTASAIVASRSNNGFHQHNTTLPGYISSQQRMRLQPQKDHQKQPPQPPKQPLSRREHFSQPDNARKSSIKSTDVKATTKSERAERVRAQSEAFWGTSITESSASVAVKSEPTNFSAAEGVATPRNQHLTSRNGGAKAKSTSIKRPGSTTLIKSEPCNRTELSTQRNQDLAVRNDRDTTSSASDNPPSYTVTVKCEPHNTDLNTSVAVSQNQSQLDRNRGKSNSARKSPESNNNSETHIIFAIDFSGSMKSIDVEKGAGQQISRWDAVFKCIPIILDGQRNDNDVGDNVVISLIIFNDQAETLLERIPLVGDGQKVQQSLKSAHKQNKPCGGTGFSVGLQRAKAVALKNKNSKITLVFLSDGRPGDLHTTPPAAGEPMQPTFKRMGKTYPSAAVHLKEMKLQFGSRFNLQIVCLCEQGRPWLEYLANRYEGAFHMSELKMEDDDVKRPSVARIQQQNMVVTHDEPIEIGGSDSDSEDIMDMVVKSQETLLREKYKRALAAGNVHSIAHTATAATSMRSTFQSISSTVTAMRHGSLRERQVVLESLTGTKSAKRRFEATHMVLDKKKERFIVKPGEKVNGKTVWIAMQPFAQGGLRNVFDLGKTFGTGHMVGKESKHEIPYAQRLQFHRETSRCQDRALEYTRAFNKRVNKRPNLKQILKKNRLQVLRAELYRVNDPKSPGGFRYLSVEAHLKGKYEKWNSNNGFVHESNSLQSQLAQAFSHFSFEYSKQKEMVVDIQGSGFTYTDPQLHSKEKEYGRADRGSSGFDDFFKTHKCSDICKELRLNQRPTIKCENTK